MFRYSLRQFTNRDLLPATNVDRLRAVVNLRSSHYGIRCVFDIQEFTRGRPISPKEDLLAFRFLASTHFRINAGITWEVSK